MKYKLHFNSIPLICFIVFVIGSFKSSAQVTLTPSFATVNDNNVSITFDASQGNAGVLGEATIYAHTGVITNLSTQPSDWKYVIAPWTTNLPKALLTRVGTSSLYTLNIGNIKTFYGVPAGETVLKLAFVFRNADGSKTGKTTSGGDIFVDVNQGVFQVKFVSPTKGLFLNATDSLNISGLSSTKCALKITAQGATIASLPNDSIINKKALLSSLGSGRINLILEGNNNGVKTYDTSYVITKTSPNIGVSPTGISDGINYINDSTVTLQLYAPYKNYVYVLGDFNNWEYFPNYQMTRTPDGSRYWITLTGLQKGVEYAFQYSIDDVQMRVGDIYADKVLDPNNDKFILTTTYPNLKPYPTGKTTEVATVFQIGQTPFNWTATNYKKPASDRLIIYETLMRDFLGTHDYKTLKDTLSYFKGLGINCIELMPFNEFEGNESWGYNPMYYMAPDKYYGDKNSLKSFIDECHKNNIAVVMDIVFNHSYGQNPQVRMYFDPTAGQYGQPTAQSPWFNPTCPHPFGTGYDYNHESNATRSFIDRVLKYWITDYKIDGFRFDLSKGFTQKNTGSDVASWGAYDQSRIDNLNRIKSQVVTYAPDAYLILEHFADNSEETVLANAGFLMWGNLTNNYAEVMMGYNNSKSDLSWGNYKARSFTYPNLVTYAESHDEERMMYKALTYGNSSGSYNVKDLNTALKRQAAYHAFLLLLKGPKMMWMGGELGYDVSIASGGGNTSNKPFHWDYLSVPERKKVYADISKIAQLKQNISFGSDNYSYNVNGTGKIFKNSHDSLNTIVVGNFDVVSLTMQPGFQKTGWWYNYITGDSINITTTTQSITINPGDYLIYTDRKLTTKTITLPNGISSQKGEVQFSFFPNPANDFVTISTSGTKVDKVEIYTMTGERLSVATSQPSINALQVDVQNLAKGMYILNIMVNGQMFAEKLMIE